MKGIIPAALTFALATAAAATVPIQAHDNNFVYEGGTARVTATGAKLPCYLTSSAISMAIAAVDDGDYDVFAAVSNPDESFIRLENGAQIRDLGDFDLSDVPNLNGHYTPIRLRVLSGQHQGLKCYFIFSDTRVFKNIDNGSNS